MLRPEQGSMDKYTNCNLYEKWGYIFQRKNPRINSPFVTLRKKEKNNVIPKRNGALKTLVGKQEDDAPQKHLWVNKRTGPEKHLWVNKRTGPKKTLVGEQEDGTPKQMCW